MIVAIEGLIPDHRVSSSEKQPTAPPVPPQIYTPEWRRRQQHQAAGTQPGDPVAATEAQPAAPQVSDPEPPPNSAPRVANDVPPPPLDRDFDRNFDPNQPSLTDPLIIPQGLNRVPLATGGGFEDALHATRSLRLPFSTRKAPLARRR
jgi:hypothetical protein